MPTAPGRKAHEIDFKIVGEELQFVEVELDPGESAIAEAGSMMYMTSEIEMNTIFGDGSSEGATTGIVEKLLGAGKRLLTGESLFMTLFTNAGSDKQRVAFAAPYAGRIVAMDLSNLGHSLICQKDSFLCAARGVSIGIAFQKKIGVGLFGGEGFIMQRLDGDGLCFKIKSALFGGEGIFFASLTGPGRIWLQSLPFSRLADRIYKAIPSMGRSGKGEGSILGSIGIGNMLSGD
ncbi:MAG: AIM24 family protein [Acidobacteriota bacterium]